MIGQNRKEKFQKAEELFETDEDQEVLKANKREYENAQELLALTNSPGGKILVKEVKDEITKSLQMLIDTRQGRYLSDLNSALNLLIKLTGVKNQAEAIGTWIDSLEP